MRKLADLERLAELRARMKALDETFHSLYRAYYGRRQLGSNVPDFETLRSAAQDLIRANYDYQKARYGRIILKLSVSKLLR